MKRFLLIIIAFSTLVFSETNAQNTIESYIWDDLNGDGIQNEGGITGISGASPQLWEDVNANGTIDGGDINTMIVPTEAGGTYTFSAVPDGDYIIRFSASGTHYLTNDNYSGVTGEPDADDDSDAVIPFPGALTGDSHAFNLLGGVTKDDVDAGFFLTSSIGNLTWDDQNGNGVQNGEPGIGGISVDLTDEFGAGVLDVNGNPVTTIVTPGNGAYNFTDLVPGNYIVVFTPPAGLFLTYEDIGGAPNLDSDPDPVTGETSVLAVTSGTTELNIDAGFYGPSTIGNFVWEDINGNGIQDGGEPGIAGIDVEITDDLGANVFYPNGAQIGPAVTDGAGNYVFDDVPPGDYIVNFSSGTGYLVTYPDVTGANTDASDVDTDSDADPTTGDSHVINIMSGETEERIDAGFYLPSVIGNLVWEDLDGNGEQNPGEPGIGGVTVNITDDFGADVFYPDGTQIMSEVSDGAGAYSFDDLPPGEFRLNFETPVGHYHTEVDVNGLNLDSNDEDIDSDCDPNNGNQTHLITITSDETENRIDAGYFLPSTIGDFVWEDMDGNGLQDAGEPGIDGVSVDLTDDLGAPVNDVMGNPVTTQVTAGGGFYDFEELPPGNYIVTFTTPTDYYHTTPDVTGANTDATDISTDSDCDPGNSNQTHVIIITSDEDQDDIDAGYFRAASVGDYAWHDADGDGLQGAAEPRQAGIGVILSTAGGAPVTDVNGLLVANQITDGAGFYTFTDLPPGDYYITFINIPDYVFTPPDAQGGPGDVADSPGDSDADEVTGETHVFNLESNEEETRIDVGIYRLFNIGGTVFFDDPPANGTFDAGENGIGNVQVFLFDADTGTNLGGELTDGFGEYTFEDITPGNYYILVDEGNFMGGPLTGNTSSPGQVPAQPPVDNDDNGDDDVSDGSQTTVLQLLCLPGAEFDDSTIDFGFFFDCNSTTTTLSEPSCEMLDEMDLICDLNVLNNYCASMGTNLVGNFPTPLCPDGGGAHNMSWFSFVAGIGNYSIEVEPFNCQPGGMGLLGVQTGIYTDCTFSTAIICNSACSTAPVTLNGSALTPGETYYFFLDGCAGSICDYNVNITGTFTPFQLPEPTSLECSEPDCGPICPGADMTFTVEGIDLEIDYFWDIPAGVTVNDPNDPQDLTTVNEISLNFPTVGDYTICMEVATNGCDQTDTPVCKTVTVEEIPDEVFDPEGVCEGDIVTYTGPTMGDPNMDGTVGWQDSGHNWVYGNNMTTVITPEGCMYDQEIEIIELPDSEPEPVEAAACEAFMVGSVPVDNNVEDVEIDLGFYGISAANSCDTSIMLTAYILSIDGAIEDGICLLGGVQLTFNELISSVTGTDFVFNGGSIDYEWIDPNGDVVDSGADPTSIEANISGEYTLNIDMNIFGISCIYPFTFDLDYESYLPSPPTADSWSQTVCENSPVVTYTVTTTDPDVVGYVWTVGGNVQPGETGSTFTYDWTGSSGGEVCATAENLCGQSDPVCLEVTVIPELIADFDIAVETCIDSTVLITFTGNETPTLNYTWNFDGGTVTNGTGGMGIGPHEVSWPTPGTKTISVSTADGGCVSEEVSKTIEVFAPEPPPVIICNPSTTGVEFTWDPVNGATDYTVNIIDGPPGAMGTLNNTTFTVDNLMEGDSITIQIITHTDSPCGDIISLVTPPCRVQDCTPAMISLSAVNDTICLVTGVGTETIDVEIDPPTDGSGTFSGNGISDPSMGIFDPAAAGPGVHQITYQFVASLDNCQSSGTIIFEVFETPTSDFSVSTDTICISEVVSVMYEGNITTGNYTWDTDGGSTGSGIGPFDVSWTTPGLKTISLDVDKDGCVSEQTTRMVLVQEELLDPNIICGDLTSTTSVEFEWETILNATDYTIIIDGTTIGNQTNTDYFIDGLNPGDQIEIEVIANSDNFCPSTSTIFTCTAENCPPTTLNITAVDTICNINDGSVIDLMYTVEGGLMDGSGTEVWTGNGVTDPGGVFDPATAGEGSHVLTLTYSEGNCTTEETLIVHVNNQPTASFASLDTICILDTLTLTYDGAPNTHDYIWSTPGGNNAGDNGPVTTAYWTTPGDYMVSLQLDNNGCLSESFTQAVTVEPELSTPIILCGDLTSSSSVEFEWSTVANATDYTVWINGVLIGNQTNTDYFIDNLNPGDEIEIQIMANSDNSCPSVMSTFTCIAENCPPTTLNLLPQDTVICNTGNTLTLDYSVTGGFGDGTGAGIWSGDGVTNPFGIFDPAVAGEGTHAVTLTYIEGNCTTVATANIEVYNQPVASFTGDLVICVTDTLTLTYDGVPNNYDYTWDVPGSVISAGNGTAASAHWDAPGDYTVSLTLNNNGCESEFSQVVTVEPELEPLTIDCQPSVNDIAFTWNAIDCASEYEVFVGGVSQGVQSGTSFDVTGLSAGDLVSFSVTAISECECDNVSMALECEAIECPDILITFDNPNSSFCEGDVVSPFQIGTTLSNSDGTGSGTWSGTGVDANGMFNPTGLTPDTYTLTYDYLEKGCDYSNTTTVTINPLPSLTLSSVDPTCYLDNTGTATITAEGGDGNYTVTLDGVSVTPPDVSGINAGSHIIEITDGNGCGVQDAFTITPAATPTLDLSGPSVIEIEQTGNLTYSVSNLVGAIDSVVWTSSTGILCDVGNCETITIAPLADDTYCLEIFYNNGCKVEDCLFVRAQEKEQQVIISNIFSPDGDNPENSLFTIEFYGTVSSVSKVRIFDRWGNAVFVRDNPDISAGTGNITWDGTFNNQKVNPGVYVYMIETQLEDGQIKVFNGDITVVR